MDTIDPSASIDVLDLPMRAYNALRRNGVRTVSDLTALSEVEILRFRYVGEGTLRDLLTILDRHGLALADYDERRDRQRTEARMVEAAASLGELRAAAAKPERSPAPEWAAGAEWIGRQLDALAEDSRVSAKNGLGGRWTGEGAELLNRRRAWAWYRWGTSADADWPRNVDGGFGFMAAPLPGALELHLEGLNRLAHEELGDE